MTTRIKSKWLPPLIGPVVLYDANGVRVPPRATWNFTNLEGTDNGVEEDSLDLELVADDATTSAPGFMSAADKTKLDGLQTQGAAVAIAAAAIDWSLGGVFTKALASGATTFTFSNATSGKVIIVRLTSNAGGSAVTWPTVKWAGGTPPTMSTPSKRDAYTFFHDGTDIYGSVVADMS